MKIPPNKYDFYHIALHEIGHAVGLQHVNDKKDVMYWSETLNSTTLPSSLRNCNLYTSPYAISAGIYAVYNSYSNAYPCFWSGITPFDINLCGFTNSYFNVFNNKFEIYPNPFTNEVNIETDFESTVEIYNMSGKLVIKLNNVQNRIIDSSFLSTGIYFLKLVNKLNTYYSKIIKQDE